MVSDAVWSNIDEVFIFGDFNVYHKDWLTYSAGTDRPGELCYNFSIANDLIQMVNFSAQILNVISQSFSFGFISSDVSICSTYYNILCITTYCNLIRNILRLLMFYQIFFSLERKWIVIISNKYCIYELPQELPKNLRLRKLGNISKISNLHRIMAKCPVLLLKWKFCQY